MTNSEQTQENNPLATIATTDGNAERLAKLKSIYPDLFTNEGKLDITELQKLVDPNSVNETEKFEFKWFGKSQAKRNAFAPTNATLVFDEARSINPQNSQNIIIEGENLEVLKLLKEGYREKIKCIYIDPPYNTGKDFVYSDNFTQDKKAYWQDNGTVNAGLKVDSNSESDGRYHSYWLNMMFSRLLLARDLLRDDGVIFISIGDHEVHHLRKLCDEVFGESNFEGHIHWRRRHNQPNDKSKMIGLVAEHIISYSKNKEAFKASGVGKVDLTGSFSNADNDPRGDWASKPWKVGSDQSGSRYSIKNPYNDKVYDEEWMGDEANYLSLLQDNRIVFPKNGEGLPRKKYFHFEREQEGQCATNWWTHEEFGHNQGANDLMTELFGVKNVFSNPKPIELIRGVIQLSNAKSGDYVLDFFGGSGSTGHAVIDFNREENTNLKFILVQLPEQLSESDEAYNAGYKKISDITIARISKVAEKLRADGFETGFKVFKLTMSNFPRVMFEPDLSLDEAANLERLHQYINEKERQLFNTFDEENLLTEILIKRGFNLNYQTRKAEQFAKNNVLWVDDGVKKCFVCLDNNLADETVSYFTKNIDQHFVCLERAIDTTKKWNLKHAMGHMFFAF